MSRVLFLLLAGFGVALAVGLVIAEQLRPPPTVPDVDILPATVAATLESLVKVDDHPLYTMRYIGAYSPEPASISSTQHPARPRLPHDRYPAPTWACSLFAALGDEDGMLYGRNFDWTYSPGAAAVHRSARRLCFGFDGRHRLSRRCIHRQNPGGFATRRAYSAAVCTFPTV